MGNHRLFGMRCYLSGAMDRVLDHGVQWRNNLTPFLEDLGIIVLNPCCKPIETDKTLESRDYRTGLKEEGEYEFLGEKIERLRRLDMCLVSSVDFLIVNIDTTVHACGTYEELSLANMLKKPILIRCEQGKVGIPDWILGMTPHQHIFSKWEEIESYLIHVHTANEVEDFDRWIFFDYSKMLPKWIFILEPDLTQK